MDYFPTPPLGGIVIRVQSLNQHIITRYKNYQEIGIKRDEQNYLEKNTGNETEFHGFEETVLTNVLLKLIECKKGFNSRKFYFEYFLSLCKVERANLFTLFEHLKVQDASF